MNLVNKRAIVSNISDELGCVSDDKKYTGKAYNKVVTIKHKLTSLLYITDFFIPEFINENNDYIHYGFLVVSENNITLLKD